MSTISSIANIAPMMTSLALVGENVRVAKKKKKTAGDFLTLGVTNIVGTSMIKAQSDLIGGL